MRRKETEAQLESGERERILNVEERPTDSIFLRDDREQGRPRKCRATKRGSFISSQSFPLLSGGDRLPEGGARRDRT